MRKLLVLPLFVVSIIGVVAVAQEAEKEGDKETTSDKDKTCEELKATFDTPSAFKIGEDDEVKASVPKDEVIKGIRGRKDPRDAIPPIYDPKFESIEDADPHNEADDRVLVYVHEDTARAYPHKVLNRHEIANDKIGELEFMVIY